MFESVFRSGSTSAVRLWRRESASTGTPSPCSSTPLCSSTPPPPCSSPAASLSRDSWGVATTPNCRWTPGGRWGAWRPWRWPTSWALCRTMWSGRRTRWLRLKSSQTARRRGSCFWGRSRRCCWACCTSASTHCSSSTCTHLSDGRSAAWCPAAESRRAACQMSRLHRKRCNRRRVRMKSDHRCPVCEEQIRKKCYITAEVWHVA